MLEFEICIKGVEQGIYAIGTQKEYEQIIEFMGTSTVFGLEDSWGNDVVVSLKDCYAVYVKPSEEDESPDIFAYVYPIEEDE